MYKCTNCNYKQDFEPTKENMAKYYWYNAILDENDNDTRNYNECPKCKSDYLTWRNDDDLEANIYICRVCKTRFHFRKNAYFIYPYTIEDALKRFEENRYAKRRFDKDIKDEWSKVTSYIDFDSWLLNYLFKEIEIWEK